ncbi:putative homeobox-leucine zipper protein ATHB-51 [Cucurbita pepo subsp. pepo]|uniref:putative homeobox-leucine zipper protein ATHB-51 n=1 Tax=Cucurbita pepo subsp. pepo TaxID=3664 RepID=UPI000C9D35F2|nr:putative homeobox-leucine zipper protein ATHB-51 [Cucurbita pepo subsp. pepo]
MEWNNGSLTPKLLSPPLLHHRSSYTPCYNYNYIYNLDHFPVLERKNPAEESVVGGVDQKKKKKTKTKLSPDQLESLERRFQEEVKLDPDRKMKLSKELGLQPRQIAIWFQNRRARWKTKQLQHLYDTLKQEFDTISNQKHTLQQQVMKLKTMLLLREEATRNPQGSMAYTDEETAESTSVGVRSSTNNYTYNNKVEDLVEISGSGPPPPPPFWWGAEEDAHRPSYP